MRDAPREGRAAWRVPAQACTHARWAEVGEVQGVHRNVDPRVNGEYRLWSGTVQGRFIELEANKKIVKTWRTAEFALNMRSSVVTMHFTEQKNGTRLIVEHEDIPDLFTEQFRFGWEDYYFPRLKRFFISH